MYVYVPGNTHHAGCGTDYNVLNTLCMLLISGLTVKLILCFCEDFNQVTNCGSNISG